MKRKICVMLLMLGLLLCLLPQTAVPVEAAEETFFGVLISDTEGNVNTGGSYSRDYPGLEDYDARKTATNNFVEIGKTVCLEAYPDNGYRFVGWFQGEPDPQDEGKRYTGEPLETDTVYQFTAPIDLERPYVCAVFEEASNIHQGDQVQMWVGNTDGRAGDSTVMGGKVAVKYTPSWNDWPDSIVAKDGTNFVYGEILQFYKGDECTVYAQPDEGYRFVGWYHVNIEWGPGEGKSYEGDVISTETSFTYKPGETIVAGDSEPLRYVCAVFEEAGPCTVSFDPGTGKGSMASVIVDAGEEYELPKCTFTHDNSKRVFYRWSVNDELIKAGDSITVNEDTVVTAKWKYTDSVTTDNGIDKSTTEVIGSLKLTDLRTGSVKNEVVYDQTTSSSFVMPETPTTNAMIEEALAVLNQKAQDYAGGSAVTKISDGTFGVNKTCTRGHIMTFVWRFKGQPAPKTVAKSPFSDVPKNHAYYKAILWGSQKGVTKGMGDGTFGINKNCTRGQIVTFLYRIR